MKASMNRKRTMHATMRAIATTAILIATSCLSGLTAAGPGVHPHADILETARGFLAGELGAREGKADIRLGELDRRLRLARCDRPLEGYLPSAGSLTGNISVGVRCTGSHPWKIFVPARVALIETVVVSRGFLARGTVLGEDHIMLAEREITAPGHGYIKDIDQALGRVLRQPVRDGLVINPAMLDRPRLVRRGDEVLIVSEGGAFEVRMKGSALSDGAEGDRIQVRNGSSRRVVEGRVASDGTIMVKM